MTPKEKIFAFGTILLISYGSIVSSIFLFFDRGYPHARIVALLDVILVVATTVFASSSKFAKEVAWFLVWRRKTGHRLNEYPQTREDKDRFEEELHSEVAKLGRAVNGAKNVLEGAEMKRPRDRQAICGARAKFQAKLIEFNEYWELLKHLKMKPRNPTTGRLYKNRKEFLKGISDRSQAVLMVMHAVL